jgi:hypothetical protein
VEAPTGIARASGMLISGLMRIATSLFPIHRGPSYLWRLIRAHNPNGELLVFLNTRDSFCQQIGNCDRARNCSGNGFVIAGNNALSFNATQISAKRGIDNSLHSASAVASVCESTTRKSNSFYSTSATRGLNDAWQL